MSFANFVATSRLDSGSDDCATSMCTAHEYFMRDILPAQFPVPVSTNSTVILAPATHVTSLVSRIVVIYCRCEKQIPPQFPFNAFG